MRLNEKEQDMYPKKENTLETAPAYNKRTNRIEMHFTLEELETLAWLLKSEIRVQEMLIDESDGTLLKHLTELYESITW